jgi:hypothetical protein
MLKKYFWMSFLGLSLNNLKATEDFKENFDLTLQAWASSQKNLVNKTFLNSSILCGFTTAKCFQDESASVRAEKDFNAIKALVLSLTLHLDNRCSWRDLLLSPFPNEYMTETETSRELQEVYFLKAYFYAFLQELLSEIELMPEEKKQRVYKDRLLENFEKISNLIQALAKVLFDENQKDLSSDSVLKQLKNHVGEEKYLREYYFLCSSSAFSQTILPKAIEYQKTRRLLKENQD